MIYIDINGKTPPEDWCRRAARLTERLKSLHNREERIELIRQNERLWQDQDLKAWLKELSHGKCWYSEAKELVSDYHIDHFRPKSSAKQLDETERDGYWWLAFNWKNYRIAGAICNSLHCGTDGETYGKSTYFPVKGSCATTQECDLKDEIIYLLDPTNPHDPPLLTFDESGKAIPATRETTWQYDRAIITIKLLHLNYVALTDERKKIWKKCSRLLNEAENIMYLQRLNASVTANVELNHIVDDLLEMISPSSELSSTACACLLNSSSIWARRLLLN